MTGRYSMICVRLDGGLGNQLFQYAAGRALALRHGAELVVDDGSLRRAARGATPRQLELHRFRPRARMASRSEQRWLPLARRLPGLSVGPWRTYVERGLTYNAAFSTLPDRTYLVGYWQSPRYFETIADTLLPELQPAAPLSEHSAALVEQIRHTASVAVHVRRGDYVTLQSAARFHGVLPNVYYAACIERIQARVDAPHFFVFSDDPQWCRVNLQLHGAQATHVSHNGGSDAWQDLVLMGHCRHHVIANSSFSWWGAWLGDRRVGITRRHVFAPARWFDSVEHDTRDRFPAHWEAVAA